MNASETIDGGVLIQVIGEISNDSLPSRPFVQSVLLAPFGSLKYYIRNEVFKYLDCFTFVGSNLSFQSQTVESELVEDELDVPDSTCSKTNLIQIEQARSLDENVSQNNNFDEEQETHENIQTPSSVEIPPQIEPTKISKDNEAPFQPDNDQESETKTVISSSDEIADKLNSWAKVVCTNTSALDKLSTSSPVRTSASTQGVLPLSKPSEHSPKDKLVGQNNKFREHGKFEQSQNTETQKFSKFLVIDSV